jgi:hypothetical protein
MNLDINTSTIQELAEFSVDHCVAQGFSEDDIDKITGITNWFIATQNTLILFNLIVKGYARIQDYSDHEGPFFSLTEKGREWFDDQQFSHPIWGEIRDIIESKEREL